MSEQKFVVSKVKKAQFEPGMRGFFEYRDLGIGEATGGRYHAHVIRATDATTEGTGKHTHSLDFQMVYVLKGWAEFWYDGEGKTRIEAGDAVLQPPGIKHDLMACSDDLELLEVTSPADFGTESAED